MENSTGRPDPGKRPEARWIDKRLLTVEPLYQRAVSSKRGQALIEKLAMNWVWAHASVLVVAPRGEGWTIIDGQHRHQAAMRRPDIKDLLCIIVDAPLLKHQAQAFIAHNRDRVTLNFLALFHATLAAGDPACQKVIEACAASGVEICRTVKTVDFLKPHETQAVGALESIVKAKGPEHLVRVLNVIRSAYPKKNGQLRSTTIKAVDAIMEEGATDDQIRAALADTDGIRLEDAARALRQDGNSIIQGFIITLGRACGLAIDNKKIVRAKRSLPTPATASPPPAALRSPVPPKPKAVEPPKKTAKPFSFDRSQPTLAQIKADKKLAAELAAKASPSASEQVASGSATVRRFEPGSQIAMIDKALLELGLTMIKRPTGPKPYIIGNRKFSLNSLIDFIDAHRRQRGLTPMRK